MEQIISLIKTLLNYGLITKEAEITRNIPIALNRNETSINSYDAAGLGFEPR